MERFPPHCSDTTILIPHRKDYWITDWSQFEWNASFMNGNIKSPIQKKRWVCAWKIVLNGNGLASGAQYLSHSKPQGFSIEDYPVSWIFQNKARFPHESIHSTGFHHALNEAHFHQSLEESISIRSLHLHLYHSKCNHLVAHPHFTSIRLLDCTWTLSIGFQHIPRSWHLRHGNKNFTFLFIFLWI